MAIRSAIEMAARAPCPGISPYFGYPRQSHYMTSGSV